MNKDYLITIRANSCYPTYRMLVYWFSSVSYMIVGLTGSVNLCWFFLGLGGISKYREKLDLFFAAAMLSLFVFFILMVTKEVSLMFVDVADATIESAGRRKEPVPSQAMPDSKSLRVEPVLLQDMPDVESPQVIKKQENESLSMSFIVICAIAIAIGLSILIAVAFKLWNS